MTSKTKKIKKLILHIGAHKTGTTAIQNFLFFNSNKINKHGFYLPLFLYNEERTPKDLRISIVKKDVQKAEKYLEEIVDRANQLFCDTVIISDENYCKVSERDFSTAEVFSRYFDEVIVLMYCRRQDRELESRYAFRVMYHEAKLSGSPQEWYGRYKGRDYYEIAKYYEKTIDGCEISIESYDKNSSNLIKSFIDVCNIPEDDYVLPNKSESNISANKYVIEVMSKINNYFMSDELFEKIRGYLQSHELLQNGPKAVFCTMNDRIECMKRFEKSNKELSREYYDNNQVFDDITDIKVPEGLSANTKQMIVNEVISKFDLKYSQNGETHKKFRANLAIKDDILSVDIFREVGIMCSNHQLKISAYRFIQYAYYLRGDGPLIIRYLKELKSIVEKRVFSNFDYQAVKQWHENPLYNKDAALKAMKRFRKNLRVPFYITAKKAYNNIGAFCKAYGEIECAGYFHDLASSLKYR